MKKSALFVLLAALSLTQPVLAQISNRSYSDVSKDHWAYQALQELAEKYHLQLGYPDGSFRGQEVPTRYEIAALLRQVLNQLDILSNVDSEDQELLEQLKSNFEAELSSLDERISILEDASDLQSTELQDLGDSFAKFQAQMPFRFFGSLALRYCGMSTNVLSEPDKIFGSNLTGSNLQSRFGGGIRGQVGEDLDYELRVLSTQNDSFNLSWFPFGGNHIARLPLWLDRYFIRWQALKNEGITPNLRLSAGKAPNFLPETQLLADEDISLNGLQQELSWQDLTPFWKSLRFETGEHIVWIEDTFIRTSQLAAKASADFEFGPDWNLRLATSYSHLFGTDFLAAANLNQGYEGGFSQRNRGAANKDFESDFGLLNGFGKLTWRIAGSVPLSLFADYVQNIRAKDQNTAWLVGATLGDLRKVGHWELSYSYRQMQQDYNLSVWVDDFYSGTDVGGHVVNLAAQVAKQTTWETSLITRSSVSQPDKGNLSILYTGFRQSF